MKKILVYPYYNNPYQSLLYKEVTKDTEITIEYLRSKKYSDYLLLIVMPLMIIQKKAQGFKIFHLHWVAFCSASENKVTQIFSFIYTLFMILFIKLLGYKLIWTMHNITPHERITIDDLLITKILCTLCDRKIVHSQQTIEELQKIGYSITKTTIIPHGSYISYY